MSTIASMAVKLQLNAQDFERGIGAVAAKAESFSKKLSGIGQAMSLAVTTPLVGIAGAALKSAGDFEQSMSVLQSVSGATTADMAALQAQALQLGADTAFSAGEAASAMLELGKAGLDTTSIMGAVPGVLDLAAAGNMDVGAAAGIAANAVNTFNLAATETSTVANMLAAAANASSADVGELAAGMQQAGAVFASNGQSLSDLTTAMSLMANAGIAGSDAGTSLKTMLMSLAAPTDAATAAMDSLGLNVYNADGSMRTFEAIVGDLSSATAGLTDSQRNAALATIFGSDAIRAANILVAAGAEGFAAMETSVTAAGAAQEAAAARMGGFNGAMESLKGSIDSLLIAIGSQFLDDITSMVSGITNMVNGFATLDPALQTAILAFGGVAAVMGPVLTILPGLVAGFTTLGAIIGAIGAPVYLVIAAVALLAAAWATDFGGIQTATKEAWAAVQPALAAAQAWLQTNIPAALAILTSAWDTTWNGLAAVVATVQEKWTAFSTAVSDLLSGRVAFNIALPKWLDTLLAWAWPALPGLPSWLNALLRWAWPDLPSVPTWITDLIDWAWPAFPSLPDWVSNLFDWDWPHFPEIPGWIQDLFNFQWPVPQMPDVGGAAANAAGAINDLFGFGGRAAGGPVTAGTPYYVGERGVELFVPSTSGTIVPNTDLPSIWDMAGSAGEPVTINNFNTIYNQVDVEELSYKVAQRLARRR